MALFAELKRRNVFRVGLAYAVLAWVVIQVTDTVAPVLHLPDWTLALVIWIGIIGFPFALVLAWAFELTPEGLKREHEVDRSSSITSVTGRKLDFAIIGLLAMAVVFFIVHDYVLKGTTADEAGTVDSTSGAAKGRASYDSIAVLPFVNMSSDPDQAYLSDGLAEELLNLLARINGLKVAARTSSFAFRDKEQDIRKIGDTLKVSTVLEGSVRKSGERIRITAQLIDVANGYHLWSETFDRKLTDIFQIQDEISAAIVAALRVHLDAGAATATRVTNMAAYDLYLQGRHLRREARAGNTRKALDLFRRASDADPEFAAAWAAQAAAVIALRETQYREGIPAAEAVALAQSNIDRALALDPSLAEAYVSQSMLYWDRYRFDEALASIDKAIAINPNLAEAYKQRAVVLKTLGRVRDAKHTLDIASGLDPLDWTVPMDSADLALEYRDEAYLVEVLQRQQERLTNGGSAQEQDAMQRLTLLSYGLTESSPAKVYQRLAASTTDRFARMLLVDWKWDQLKQIDEQDFDQRRNPDLIRMFLAVSMDQQKQAQQIYDSWTPERQAVPIALEALSLLQMNRGDCAAALASLERAHGGNVPIYGQIPPSADRANSNLALNRVYCLRRLGRRAAGDPIMDAVRPYIETLRQNAVHGYILLDAKFRLLDGDKDGALDTLERGAQAGELSWSNFADPVLRSLAGEPRYVALKKRLDRFIDAERAKLGWPPASF
jgi:TolB-like protein